MKNFEKKPRFYKLNFILQNKNFKNSTQIKIYINILKKLISIIYKVIKNKSLF